MIKNRGGECKLDINTQQIKQKIDDYSRFLITLIILSIYFYLGMIITNFIEPSNKGVLIVFLLLFSLSLAGWFLFLITKWRKQLNKLLED